MKDLDAVDTFPDWRVNPRGGRQTGHFLATLAEV
jgi:hypothetical protein